VVQWSAERSDAGDASKLNSGLEDLDPTECMELVKQEVVGRLGVVVDGRPEILPVNFVIAGEEVLIRTDQGTKLSSALAGPVVFEVDRIDPETRTGWSVMLHGTAQLTSTREGRSGSQNRVLESWREAELPQLLRIVPGSITGRRIPAPTGHRWPRAGTSS
jgi:uncharacterized protein